MSALSRPFGVTVLLSALLPAVARRGGVQANSSVDLAGTCSVATLKKDCVCNKVSLDGSFQCSGCQDRFKWGYGCDLPCPAECSSGCDFSGNCLKPTADMFPNCKRNSRIEKPTEKSVVLNERGECQACMSGHFGLFCTEPCPAGCADTVEGKCTRSGKCYECKAGFYGETCNLLCPTSCPKCVMMDGLVLLDGKGTEYLPAGACAEQCASDHFGEMCDKPCPSNCKKSHIPSCLKDSGLCIKCEGHKYWGPSCEKPCSKGCLGDACAKDTGICEKGCSKGFWGSTCSNRCSGCKGGACNAVDGVCSDGCQPGFWGTRCDLACPLGTDTDQGCDQKSGFPVACVPGMFAELTVKGPVCSQCPSNCVDGQCNKDGSCNNGCELGFFGPRCESYCAPHCDGPCDEKNTGQTDGWCRACLPGWTGKKCTKRCHATCRTCEQHNNAVGPDSCTSCPTDEPAVLNGASCDCPPGASRSGADGKCVCDDPSDPMKIGFWDQPRNMCRYVCKEHHWEAFGNKETLCLHSDVYWSIMRGASMEQGTCESGFKTNPVAGAKPECIRQDFLDYVLRRAGK